MEVSAKNKRRKLSVFDFNTTVGGHRPLLMSKKEYSGMMEHWREVNDDPRLYKAYNDKYKIFQFAWKQKAIGGEYPDFIYPDFNYGYNAMICNLNIFPEFRRKISDKNEKETYCVMMRFDSADDDIMYCFVACFQEFNDGLSFMKVVMETFERLFKPAYKENKSISAATYETMKEMFLSNNGYVN